MSWEYKVVYSYHGVVPAPARREAVEELLNQLGEDGWELITAVFNPSSTISLFYFKRLRSDSPEAEQKIRKERG